MEKEVLIKESVGEILERFKGLERLVWQRVGLKCGLIVELV